MPQIIDIMKYQGTALIKFTADTSGPAYVALADTTGSHTICDASGHELFTKGDSFIILSMGFILPSSFCLEMRDLVLYDSYASFLIKGKGETSGHEYYFKEMTNNIYVPLESYECVVNTWINVMNQLPVLGTYIKDEDFRLTMRWSNVLACAVSMINVPSAYNGVTLEVIPFVKIIHTIQLRP